MFFGSIPKGMTINHKCSNRKCVNPHHLEVVSIKENCRKSSFTKLTAKKAKEIKYMDIPRGKKPEVAKKYGISVQTISDIKQGRSWKEV